MNDDAGKKIPANDNDRADDDAGDDGDSPYVPSGGPAREPEDFAAGAERIQKILARAGFGSRRKCEELILEGRVTVNGVKVSQLGTKADIHRDVIAVDGERTHEPKPVYHVVNKPKGWYCTEDVPDKKILDLIPSEAARLFTVGRLDKSCEGLMLATNDGRVANILTHPRYRVPKIYKIIVKGHIKFEEVAAIERALFHTIKGGLFERIKVLKRTPKSSGLRLIVYEGLPASFRDICTRFGHSVSRVTRVKVGPLELGSLIPGQTRRLAGQEAAMLQKYCEDVESGRIKVNDHRLVTAESIKKAAERTPKFEAKDRGHQGQSGGQKKRMGDVSRNRGRDRRGQ